MRIVSTAELPRASGLGRFGDDYRVFGLVDDVCCDDLRAGVYVSREDAQLGQYNRLVGCQQVDSTLLHFREHRREYCHYGREH